MKKKKLLFILALIILVFCATSVSANNATSSIIAAYLMNSTAYRTSDAVGNNSPLSEQGSPVYHYENETLGYYDLGASNWINSSVTLTKKGWSLVLWYNTTDSGAGSNHLFNWGDASDGATEQLAIYYKKDDGKMYIVVEIDDDVQTDNYYSVLYDGGFHSLIITSDGSGIIVPYYDGINYQNFTNDKIPDWSHFKIGSNRDKDAFWLKGGVASVFVYNDTLTQSEVKAINDTGIFYNPFGAAAGGGGGGGSDLINLSTPLPASASTLNYSSINFNISINSTANFNCSFLINGTINQTGSNYSSGNYVNISFGEFLGEGYYNFSFFCYHYSNVSYNETSSTNTLTIAYPDPSFSYFNYHTNSTHNFSRILRYNITIDHCPSNVTIETYINGTLNSTNYANCSGAYSVFSYNYTYHKEQIFNISFIVNSTKGNETQSDDIGAAIFYADLYNPVIMQLNYTIYEGFVQAPTNLTFRCNDSYGLTYNVTLNGNQIYYGNVTANTSAFNNTNYVNGANLIYGECSDGFGVTNRTINQTIYFRYIALINEKTAAAFNVENLSGVKVYYDDNSTSYDFLTNNVSKVNFTSFYNNKLRFEFLYSNNVVITRYVDASLDNGDLRVCVNTDPTTHYEQLMVSASERAATLKNVFANCVIAEDYTRFAYQDSMILKAYTIPSLYYLYTYDSNGNKVYLASMDGSLSTYYNLDVLEFNAEGYSLGLSREALSFSRGTNAVTIFYNNLDNDSVSTTITISQVNTSSVLFTATETDDPNQFYLVFDYSTLSLSNNTLLKIEVETTLEDGSVESLIRYFNIGASSGWISSGVAFAIAIIITIFGLTFLASKASLGWFGALVQLASIAVLAIGTSSWYSILLQAINGIILIFMLILSFQTNKAGIT